MAAKIFTVVLIAVGSLFGLISDDAPAPSPTTSTAATASKPNVEFADAYNVEDDWLIYWYICGSNLESEYGSASKDIEEMLKAKVPDNVKVLIQSGGANNWKNAFMNAGQINRCLYDSTGLHELTPAPNADMGSPDTLAGFLRFGEENYAADHKVFIFWDHGGGSVFGVCHDEQFGNMLSLNEIRDAFNSVYDADEKNPPFEMVGFDTCLMATYETANNFYGLARYMVASEEVEPGNGWEYTGLLNALGQNPAMGGGELGAIICDTYYAGCEQAWSEGAVTLSVIDLSKMPTLKAAYENFGIESLQQSVQNPKRFFARLGRSAHRSENYGGNTREKGYYDMIDLGDLAQNSTDLLPASSSNLINAIDSAVVYKVNGRYRDRGAGISGFYPYDGGDQIFQMYNSVYAAPQPHKYLYHYLIYGQMPAEASALMDVDVSTIPQAVGEETFFNIDDLEDLKIQIDKKNNAFVQLTAEQAENLSSIRCNLAYVDTESNVALYLGSDTSVEVDWDKGIARDQFDGTWLMLDEHPVYVEVAAEYDDYDLYSVPIKLNGRRCNLEIAYDYSKQEYRILGARPLNENRGVVDKQLIKIERGDRITTLHYGISTEGDDEDFTEVEVETFTAGDTLKFEAEALDDGEYLYCFEFVTPNNESAMSEFVNFTIRDGEIYTTQLD